MNRTCGTSRVADHGPRHSLGGQLGTLLGCLLCVDSLSGKVLRFTLLLGLVLCEETEMLTHSCNVSWKKSPENDLPHYNH